MVSTPPRYVNTPAWVVYGNELSPAELRTFVRVYGLGWNHDYEWTDPVGLDELCHLCGLSRRQFFAHLRMLVNRHVLRYVYSRASDLYVFDLRPAHSPPGRTESEQPDLLSAENRTVAGLHDVVVGGSSEMEHISVTMKRYLHTLRVEQQQQGGGVGGDAQCGKAHSTPADWEARLDVLAQMGVLEPVRSELAGLVWATAEYLLAWVRWLEAQHGRVGSGLVVNQIRQGERAPAVVGADRERVSPAARERYREWQR